MLLSIYVLLQIYIKENTNFCLFSALKGYNLTVCLIVKVIKVQYSFISIFNETADKKLNICWKFNKRSLIYNYVYILLLLLCYRTYRYMKMFVALIEPPVSSSDLIILLYSLTQKGYD